VIGVGCLDSLEKTFPLLINNAVPGVAIPLNKSGCKDTTVECAYVEEMLVLSSGRKYNPLDYDRLKATVREWFSKERLNRILSPAEGHTPDIAREWIGGEGKRWRPYLLAAVYQSLTGNVEIPVEVGLAAVAVECFHKASLIHDDIQDNETERYGRQTVNALYGDSIAINVGDILLGEGYRLLAQCGNMELIKAASNAHISLCRGQGMELEWTTDPQPVTMDFALDIFRNKTVPAFDVSLIMGVICAGGDNTLCEALHNYACSLGIAYQLLDDIEDFGNDAPVALRPSAVLAAICEISHDDTFIRELVCTDNIKTFLAESGKEELLRQSIGEVREMAESYRKTALDALDGVTNIELKRLLFRVTKRILK
jgi:geranylgeranyl pyrophosphate synthase